MKEVRIVAHLFLGWCLFVPVLLWGDAHAESASDDAPYRLNAEDLKYYKLALDEFDFQSWKGKMKEAYRRVVPNLDLSDIRIPTSMSDDLAAPRILRKRNEILGLTKDGKRNLFSVRTSSAKSPVEAKKRIVANFSATYKRPSDVVVLEGIGDRAYRGEFWGGHYIVFARNNVYVAVNSWSEEYPAEPLARQVDALILKMSRAPEKK